ncbi:MAG: hypothetical protein ACPLZD_05850 [Candidatus Saccharicenans sp.]|nr:MAG: hypothetical protein C0168_00370 [Candidatus Aminicenantes bacterium]HEK86590.1 hypothetical protein [Candidatus Aminicenantes bacterium]
MNLSPKISGRWISRLSFSVLMIMGLLWISASQSFAQQKLSTTIYLDYTYYLSNQGPITNPQGDPNFKNNFFTFRRAYFRYDNKINDRLSFRLTFDGDYVKAVDAAGKKDDKFRPFLKHLYFQLTDIIPSSDLKVGLTDTITFKMAEDRWGYRSVAKEIMDNYKDVTGKDIDAYSADLGVSLTGKIIRQLRYGVMLTNGAGYSHPEGDKYKKLMSQIQLIPVAGISIVGYADYEKQTATAKALTYKGDLYLEAIKNLTLGAEYFIYRNDLNVLNDQRYNRAGYSIFGRYVLLPDKLNVFARFDRYDPNNKISQDEINLTIAGLDWALIHSSLRLQPNIWFYHYNDPAKNNDLVFNMTFFMAF